MEIKKIILDLRNSYSKGYDNLSVDIIKNCSTELARPLSIIFHKSIEKGTVPDELKVAKIIPTAAILKIVLSLYLSRKSSDFNEVWYADADYASKVGY